MQATDKNNKNENPASIIREFERESISLGELYEQFQKKDIDYKIYVVRENRASENELFEIVGALGAGRSCCVFLALIDKKLVSLRMSYEEGDFADKFDSVRVEMEEDYDEYFLHIIFPAVPVDSLVAGSIQKRNRLFFDKKVYASFWEKADAALSSRLNANPEDKMHWLREFLEGLHVIHSRKRAHFDIKLENLFLVDNRLKIGDFEYYLKIEDFIHSKIRICGTPGHIAPEMFYKKKKVTQQIDIFSAGSTFARLFSGKEYSQEPTFSLDGDVILTPEEENDLKTLFKKEPIDRITNKKLRQDFMINFKIFNLYRNYLLQELENPNLLPKLKDMYKLLLDMMNIEPTARPGVNALIFKVEKILGKTSVKTAGREKGTAAPVFKINKTPITIVNWNKKTNIEIGGIKRKEHAADYGLNDINLQFVDISRRHLEISYSPSPDDPETGKIQACDLHSKHGILLNDEKLKPGVPTDLNNGDVLQLGSIITFKFTEEMGFGMLKNVSLERKRGNLLWMDRTQVKELPDKNAAILLLKKPLYLDLTSYCGGEDISLSIDDQGEIEINGEADHFPVSGDIIL